MMLSSPLLVSNTESEAFIDTSVAPVSQKYPISEASSDVIVDLVRLRTH